MPITVAYGPDINLLGSVALDAGLGAYRERQQERAQRDAMAQAELQQRGQIAAAQFQQHAVDRQFNHAADLQKMAFGSSIQDQQRAQIQDFQEAQQERAFEQQKEMQKTAAEFEKQQLLDRMSEQGKQQKAQMDRELEHINSFPGATEDEKERYRRMHSAKWSGFDPAAFALPKGRMPGDIIDGGDGSKYFIDPKGSPKKLTNPKSDLSPMFYPGTEEPILDPNTGKPALYFRNSRGDMSLLETPKKEKAPPSTYKPPSPENIYLKLRADMEKRVDKEGLPVPVDDEELIAATKKAVAAIAALQGHPAVRDGADPRAAMDAVGRMGGKTAPAAPAPAPASAADRELAAEKIWNKGMLGATYKWHELSPVQKKAFIDSNPAGLAPAAEPAAGSFRGKPLGPGDPGPAPPAADGDFPTPGGPVAMPGDAGPDDREEPRIAAPPAAADPVDPKHKAAIDHLLTITETLEVNKARLAAHPGDEAATQAFTALTRMKAEAAAEVKKLGITSPISTKSSLAALTGKPGAKETLNSAANAIEEITKRLIREKRKPTPEEKAEVKALMGRAS